MDGGCVVQAPDWDMIWSDGFAGKTVARLLRAIEAAVPGCCFGALPLAGDSHDSDTVSAPEYLELLQSSNSEHAAGILRRGTPRVSADFIGEMEEVDAMGWIRVLHPGGDQAALLAALAPVVEQENDNYGSQVTAGASVIAGGVMLRKGTTNKSVGLTAMAGRLGFTADEVCGFGDESNDWGMFGWAGHSISPSNATPETKTHAAQVSKWSHNEDFIAEALALREYYARPAPAAPALPLVPPSIRCLAFDMDGTLCTAANTITPATEAAVREFAASGGTVMIATGRSIDGEGRKRSFPPLFMLK